MKLIYYVFHITVVILSMYFFRVKGPNSFSNSLSVTLSAPGLKRKSEPRLRNPRIGGQRNQRVNVHALRLDVKSHLSCLALSWIASSELQIQMCLNYLANWSQHISTILLIDLKVFWLNGLCIPLSPQSSLPWSSWREKLNTKERSVYAVKKCTLCQQKISCINRNLLKHTA